MLTPTDKAAIEGLLKLIQPIESTDERIPDIQWIELGEAAFEAREALQRLLAGETREAVPHDDAGAADAEAEEIAGIVKQIETLRGDRPADWYVNKELEAISMRVAALRRHTHAPQTATQESI